MTCADPHETDLNYLLRADYTEDEIEFIKDVLYYTDNPELKPEDIVVSYHNGYTIDDIVYQLK